jgi:tetratricopeptide (TPR) repeat protein
VLKLAPDQQSPRLAEVVRRTAENRKCSQARVSLDKALKDGEGAWLVQCEEGQDYSVLIPAQPKKAAIVLPCILARTTAGIDCYANFRAMLPEHVTQCAHSPFPDRVIGACTAIIQSGRIFDKPTALSAVHEARALAYSRYAALDLALKDLDRAVELNPTNAATLYNRAVALERKGDLDQSIRDLNEVLRLNPGQPYANYERGYAYVRKGDNDHAIDDFNQAIRVNPTDAKAYRARAAAYEAKGDAANADADLKKARELDPSIQRLVVAPPSSPAAPTPDGLTGAERQAAYCMEASFGYTQRYTRFVAVLRENLKSMEILRDRPDLTPAKKQEIAAAIKSTTNRIAAEEETGKRWNGRTMLFIGYLQKRGLLGGAKVAAMSNEVSKDQKAVSDIYSACLRLCKPDDQSCKTACDSRATASEPSKRMLGCEQVAASFK